MKYSYSLYKTDEIKLHYISKYRHAQNIENFCVRTHLKSEYDFQITRVIVFREIQT